jgi:hypothetical protein
LGLRLEGKDWSGAFPKRRTTDMAGGLVASIAAFAVGAVLDFALTVSPDQHGFNIHTVGIILMVVGAVGAVLSLLGFLAGGGPRRHRTTVDDGRGHVVRRDDTYI